MPRMSVSSWSLHGLLGEVFHEPDGAPSAGVVRRRGRDGLPLVELPAQLREHGIATLELCHFHLPSLDDEFLRQLRSAIGDAGVELYSVLIDSGDVTAEDSAKRERDLALIRRYIDAAAVLGATGVRIDAGLAPPSEAVIARSAEGLRRLTDYAATRGVRVFTENWHETSKQPGPLLEILRRGGDGVGLCCDFGNAEGPDKYATIAALAPVATSVHCKARHHDDGSIDTDDLAHCLRLVTQAGFDGPISLIYGPTTGEWEGIDALRDAVLSVLEVEAAGRR